MKQNNVAFFITVKYFLNRELYSLPILANTILMWLNMVSVSDCRAEDRSFSGEVETLPKAKLLLQSNDWMLETYMLLWESMSIGDSSKSHQG